MAHSDISAVAYAKHLRFLRDIPAWRRVAMLGELYVQMRTVLLAGLRHHHPTASPTQLHQMLAERLLGSGPKMASKTNHTIEGLPMPTNPPLQATMDFITVCEAANVRYMVVGSLASVVHGVPRTTLDTDILADLSTTQLELFINQLELTFWVDSQQINDAIAANDSFNLIHRASFFRIDVFLVQPNSFDELQLRRRVALKLDPDAQQQVYFATREDTILAKLKWYQLGEYVSERQWQDVLGVLQIHHPTLDWQYLTTQAELLGVQALLTRAREAIGLT